MNTITISLAELVIRGIPEVMLIVLSLHVFSRTKVDKKKFFVLSLLQWVIAYLIRLLPVALGVNSILSMIIDLFLFQYVYGDHVAKTINLVVAATCTILLLAVSEALNVVLLILLFGYSEAEELLMNVTGLTKTFYTFPSIIFFALFIVLISIISGRKHGRSVDNGEAGEASGE